MTIKTHIICSKETEIALIQKDMAYMKQKVDIIHDKLIGNGKLGVLDEINQVKGSIKTLGVIGAVITFLITCIIFYANYITK